MGKASCGKREPLSGAVCTLPFDHTGEHKDLHDWRVLVYFGEDKTLILPKDEEFAGGDWMGLWETLQSEQRARTR